MSKCRILAAGVCVIALLMIAPKAFAGAPVLEFLDDFGKPAERQREPYEERIETERHDFTQSATTVGRHVFQIESGYTYLYKDNGHEIESAHEFPETLLRFGLSEDIEVRLRWSHVWAFIKEDDDRIGAEDLRFGLKLQMTRERCGSRLPTSAIEIRGSAPTASETYSTGNAQFSLDYIYQWELAERVSLAGSTSFGTNGYAVAALLPENAKDDDFMNWAQSVALGLELTEENTMYLEWFGIVSDGLADEYTISIFNLGVDHYFTDNFVADIRFGFGLTNDSEDFFSGIGGGYRF